MIIKINCELTSKCKLEKNQGSAGHSFIIFCYITVTKLFISQISRSVTSDLVKQIL